MGEFYLFSPATVRLGLPSGGRAEYQWYHVFRAVPPRSAAWLRPDLGVRSRQHPVSGLVEPVSSD
ncbi:hypothetical protein PHAMO_290126 [Magnetospirillum molischianum DSM 120]|uniref:Uncharacterized protein n=1 Tax=Magnetospirillum molischianum DSM 120 TaxID=1150626 RepID=H8FTY1_MAGML|nr:hypothetical protein PHAMO_290126 [Magnetospirillum molischianum DSM 120]